MKNWISAFTVIVFLATSLASCKKEVTPEDLSYKCNCGGFNWQGGSFALNDASKIQWHDTLYYSRDYYATAELRGGNQFIEPNSLNLIMNFEDITQLVFLAEVDTFDVLLQEVNYNDPLNVIREFVPEIGTVSIVPSLPGGNETVSFSFSMKQVVNGQLIGFPIPFSGSLSIR